MCCNRFSTEEPGEPVVAKPSRSSRPPPHDGALLAAQKRAFDLASESLRLERINYATGASGVLNVLDAQRQFERASLGYAQGQGQLYLDTLQLIVAMGGGGWDAGRPVGRNDRADP